MDEVAAEAGNVKVVRQSFRGTHGDSSLMLSTVVLSNENQTCRGWEAPTSTGGGGCHLTTNLLRTHYNLHFIEVFIIP